MLLLGFIHKEKVINLFLEVIVFCYCPNAQLD